jgi:hypothetical protein
MIRWTGEGMTVRYDGTETRITVARSSEGNGLSVAELDDLIDTLNNARKLRNKFDTDGRA